MMHFVCTFSIISAGVRLIAIEEGRSYGKVYTSKTVLEMAGGRMHTPHPTPWIRPWPYVADAIHILVTWHH